MLILISLSASIAVVALTYLVWRNSRQISHLKSKIAEAESNLTVEIEKEHKLENEVVELRNKVSSNSLNDELTGLPSRKVFIDRLEATINQSQRYHLIFAVVALDIDGFKTINDALGQDMGDKLLKEIAHRIQTSTRAVDTICRFTGDDFMLILPQLAKAETAAYLGQRFLDELSQPFKIEGQELYITASVGITIFPSDGTDGKKLLNNAESALHQAKSRGRNNYQFYREEMNAISKRELILSTDLHSETVYDNFVIKYQPLVDSNKNEIVNMESQLQWNHPDFGLISWPQLSRIADHNGRTIPIGQWMLRRVFQDYLDWKKNGFVTTHISVQISVKQLENFHFVQSVSSLLTEMSIEPETLIVEVAEVSLTSKFVAVEKMLHMLKRLGVQISINNFGTGHLSLHSLRSLPVDMLKIDNELIKDLTVNKESAAIVKMITVLAKNLHLKIIAEGVENTKQKDLLVGLGCYTMQGQLFGEANLPEYYVSKTVKSDQTQTH